MTRDEAIGVLRVITAAWPSANLGDDTVELWIEYLATVGASEGREVASELVLAEQWLPAVARFRQAVVDRRRRAAERARFALPSAEHPTPADQARAHIASLRATLGGAE